MNEEFYARLNSKYKDQLTQPFASDIYVSPLMPGPYSYTVMFHQTFRFPIAQGLKMTPSVTDRLRRGKLILEETLETLTKGLGLRIAIQGDDVWDFGDVGGQLTLIHHEGDKYDPIETADGIADMNVVNNGTAIEFGIPITSVDHEVFCSNMTKLDEDGKPILNRCQHWHDPEADFTDDTQTHCRNQLSAIVAGQEFGPLDCHEPSHLIDPTAPVGKGLKPAHYTPANVARVLQVHVDNYGVE